MQEKLDYLLLAFLHEDLPLWMRLYVRARLLVSYKLRKRLDDLAYTSSLIAGSVGKVQSVAYHANLVLRRKKALWTDLAVITCTLAILSVATVASWTFYQSASRAPTHAPPGASVAVPPSADCPPVVKPKAK